ncbi:MAG: hypothetical protein OQK13_04760, partial [Gammaproteobacteria bacterium]|nr:hypothetical protein [Gammaproteobacteria bacterium]
RGMRDKVISHAIRHAYQESVPEGRYPSYLLNLEIDPTQVDVNVHPTKHEVRFRQGRMVHDFITTSLLRAFEEGGRGVVQNSPGLNVETGELYSVSTQSDDRLQVGEVKANYQGGSLSTERRGQSPLFKNAAAEQFSLIDQRHLLFVYDTQHYLCDLHSLYQRIVDEAFEQLATGVLTQLENRSLLFPEKITLPDESLDQISADLELFRAFGIGLTGRERGIVMLTTLPQFLSGTAYHQFVHSLIAQWSAIEDRDPKKLAELTRTLIKQYGLQNLVESNGSSASSTDWLRRFSLNKLSELVHMDETLKLDSRLLSKLYQ